MITVPNSKRITTFLRLFADFEHSNPFIPSNYLDTDHLAQRIRDPLVLVLGLVENLENIFL